MITISAQFLMWQNKTLGASAGEYALRNVTSLCSKAAGVGMPYVLDNWSSMARISMSACHLTIPGMLLT